MKIDFSKYPNLNLHRPRLNETDENTFIEKMKNEGYHLVQWVDGRGYIGLLNFAFTIGLVYGLGEIDYDGRYCYQNATDAMIGLINWQALGAEKEPAGRWIKHKSKFCDMLNPNFV